ncbi:hypothetical protein M9458_052880 [Cirrhinus mrigala]|uniref:Uncharacterized protein n=1 Tax=Cirrhinus mrigala TaxID=683832 RepID=A0ABD0MPK4_CIRMR
MLGLSSISVQNYTTFPQAVLWAAIDLRRKRKKKKKKKKKRNNNNANGYNRCHRTSDEIFKQISSSTADNLKESRDILNKIVRRKLPKFVGEARLTEKNKSKVLDLNHGMKDKNPIEYVYFYSKRKPNEASPIKDYQLSSFLPKRFNEELVRVYYKRTDEKKEEEKKKMEEAEKCFQIWCDSKFGLH